MIREMNTRRAAWFIRETVPLKPESSPPDSTKDITNLEFITTSPQPVRSGRGFYCYP